MSKRRTSHHAVGAMLFQVEAVTPVGVGLNEPRWRVLLGRRLVRGGPLVFTAAHFYDLPKIGSLAFDADAMRLGKERELRPGDELVLEGALIQETRFKGFAFSEHGNPGNVWFAADLKIVGGPDV